MENIKVYDNIALAHEKMEDAKCLMEEINNGYFCNCSVENEADRMYVAGNYDIYSSLYRILIGCIDEIAKFIKIAKDACNENDEAVEI